MVLLKSKSARGRDYFYYLCKGKQQRECDLPRLPLDQVELAVAAHWAPIAISPAEAAKVRRHLHDLPPPHRPPPRGRRQRHRLQRGGLIYVFDNISVRLCLGCDGHARVLRFQCPRPFMKERQ
ncbi:hypothetical protein [Glycomyces buryatensis]